MNVLLLEDKLELSAVACEQIESRGHKVFPALDLGQAKSILENNDEKIDILIADQELSDGNGSQFAIETKAQSGDIKVVVVSGQLKQPDIEKLESNHVDFYHKPVLYSDVVQEIIMKHFPAE